MKEFLKIEAAKNGGYCITPDAETKEQQGIYIAPDGDALGELIEEQMLNGNESTYYLSTINPAHMTRREVKVPTSGDAIIGIYDGGEDFEGVRVQALGEDFVIGLHDIDNGKDDFTYDEAMKRLEELELTTFNRKQAGIICLYLDQINEKLEEAGGDAFAEDWYITNELYIPKGSSAGYTARSSWCFHGTYGCLYNDGRYYSVFRSRPSLALPLPN